jgi:hypothetical protein
MHDLNGYESYKESEDNYNTEFIAVKNKRVMLRTNKYDNLKTGSLWTIIDFNNETVKVKFDTGEVKTISKITFEHPDFDIIKIDAIPLISAWVITIHKLRGQTINYPYFILYNDSTWPNSVLYTGLSRSTDINNIYIICNREIGICDFKVDDICWEWYSNNCL